MLVFEFVIFIITSSDTLFPALSDTVYINFFVPFVLKSISSLFVVIDFVIFLS